MLTQTVLKYKGMHDFGGKTIIYRVNWLRSVLYANLFRPQIQPNRNISTATYTEIMYVCLRYRAMSQLGNIVIPSYPSPLFNSFMHVGCAKDILSVELVGISRAIVHCLLQQ